MKIGILGAGRIGANAARLFAQAGHDVFLSFARSPDHLAQRAAEIGARATYGDVADAAAFGEVVMLAVPWSSIDDVVAMARPHLDGKVLIDTTNWFSRDGTPLPEGQTSASYNQRRLGDTVRLVKAFNTLTSHFQAEAAARPPETRAVLFVAGDDASARTLVGRLIVDAGFVPVELGAATASGPMEAPRRPGAVYGEEYREAEARAVVEALRTGAPLPSPPTY